MNSPLISVIIPVYNRAEQLKRAIKSVLNQSYENVELIVVDDGSTDHTWEVIQSFKTQGLIGLQKNNGGVSSARNQGVKHALGEWIAFLDSDDEWLPNKLEKQVELIKDGFSFIHTEEYWIRNGIKVNPPKAYKKGGGDQFYKSLKLCAISPSTVLMQKSIFNAMGGFREDFPVCEDYDLWLKITSMQEVGLVDVPLIRKYAGHEGQLSTKYKAMDYWRVKSMKWMMENGELDQDKLESLKTELLKKLSILEKGYIKYNNPEKLEEVLRIKKEFV